MWVELNGPLNAEVRAIVYFTSNNVKQDVTTRSILTANTVMVFQLESHEIPDSIQEDDFRIQVALKVGMTNGSQVPRHVEEASTLSKFLALECI